MIVVADTSPLRYLILIEHAHILPLLYGRVIVPPAVVAELAHGQAPETVQIWLLNTPDWLQVQVPKSMATADELALGLGERAAIALADELSADALLIDDRDGRREAARRRCPSWGRCGYSRMPRNKVSSSFAPPLSVSRSPISASMNSSSSDYSRSTLNVAKGSGDFPGKESPKTSVLVSVGLVCGPDGVAVCPGHH